MLYLSKLSRAFVKVSTWIVKVLTCIFRPLPNKPSYSLTKILNGVEMNCSICQNCCMDFSKLIHWLLWNVTWICQSLYFSFFAKQHQVWSRVQSLLKLLLRPKVVEWVKVLNALCIWQYLFLSFETCSLFVLYKYQIFVHLWDEICRALLWKCFRP